MMKIQPSLFFHSELGGFILVCMFVYCYLFVTIFEFRSLGSCVFELTKSESERDNNW